MTVRFAESLAAVPALGAAGVIINVDTPLVSTLALLSAARYTRLPIVFVESSRRDGAPDFSALDVPTEVWVVKRALRPHGETLDAIFRELDVDLLLLVDSDVEVLAATTFELMRAGMSSTAAMGAGMLHVGGWMAEQGAPYGYYVDRMWIPFCCLRVAYVREALERGRSFAHRRQPNDVRSCSALSWLLMWRWRIPVARRIALRTLRRFRGERFGVKPSFFYYDTGADIYQYLSRRAGLAYHAIDPGVVGRDIKHFHGVTRREVSYLDRSGTADAATTEYVTARLRDHYGVDPARIVRKRRQHRPAPS